MFHPWVGKSLLRKKWQPIPVFLPGEFHGQKSLTGYISWSHKESDTTEQLILLLFHEPGSILRACKYVVLFKALAVSCYGRALRQLGARVEATSPWNAAVTPCANESGVRQAGWLAHGHMPCEWPSCALKLGHLSPAPNPLCPRGKMAMLDLSL